LDDLIRMTKILSGTRIDDTGKAIPISTSELQEAHDALLRKAPGTFTAAPEQVLGWHHQQAQACEAGGAWEAAVKHLDRLIEDGPRVDDLSFRRGLALRGQGKLLEAIATLTRTRELDRKGHGPQADPHAWLHITRELVDAYDRACQFADSEPLYRETLDA